MTSVDDLPMLLRSLKNSRRRRTLVRRRADRIIAVHGERSWSVARSRAFAAVNVRFTARLAEDVAEQVRRQLGLKCGSDTALRQIGRRPAPQLQRHHFP